jgi:hypothetical protein
MERPGDQVREELPAGDHELIGGRERRQRKPGRVQRVLQRVHAEQGGEQ